MTPDERELILDFFSRVAEQGAADKDRAAEALISQELRRNPDAAYLLVQTAIVYEHQLAELEDRVRDLEQQVAGRDVPDADDGRGSFLGGRLGQPRAPVRSTGAGYGMPRAGTVTAAPPLQSGCRSSKRLVTSPPQAGSVWAGRWLEPQAEPGRG